MHYVLLVCWFYAVATRLLETVKKGSCRHFVLWYNSISFQLRKNNDLFGTTHLELACSESTIEALERVVKSLESQQERHKNELFWCFSCWLWTSKCQLGIG